MDLNKYNISILVAYTKSSRVIGAQGKIPWNLSSERNRFKEICKNKYILMGRKSFEEIGHALSYCTIIIISRTLTTTPENCLLANSIESAVQLVPDSNSEILIAGGQEIYEQILPFAKKIYATEIYDDFTGDRHFPKLNSEWKQTYCQRKNEANHIFDYVTYKKI